MKVFQISYICSNQFSEKTVLAMVSDDSDRNDAIEQVQKSDSSYVSWTHCTRAQVGETFILSGDL